MESKDLDKINKIADNILEKLNEKIES